MLNTDIISNGRYFNILNQVSNSNVRKEHIKKLLYKYNMSSVVFVLHRNDTIYLDYRHTSTGNIPFQTLDELWTWVQNEVSSIGSGFFNITHDAIVITHDAVIVTHQ